MESTLTLARRDLKSAVGFFLGWGRGPDFGGTAWSTDQDAEIEFCVQSGLRRFYFAEAPNGGFYEWSFLKPIATLLLPVNVNTIPLPDDYGGIEGPITCTVSGTAANASIWWPVMTTHEGAIRQQYATLPTSTGRPLYAAEQPLRNTTAQQGQRFQLYVFPLPDLTYQLQFAYSILPDALTASVPIPWGGAAHAETILEACLAVAEERLDDTKSVHAEAFARRLAASMAQDRRRKPQLLGYNADRSDYIDRYSRDRALLPITVNGLQP